MDDISLKDYFTKLEAEFCQATAERGAEGWTSYFAEDGAMVGKSGRIEGKEAIYKAMEKGLAIQGLHFVWSPNYVVGSDDRSLVLSSGSYERKFIDSKGELIVQTGYFTTIWKRQADGSYKIIQDTGN